MFKMQAGAISNIAPQDVQLSSGVRLEVRDESLKDVHIRGGRGGEVLYMVDGVPVTHPLYGGRSVLDLNVNDVDEVELLTGAFNAEYGQAQSGVINITTRSGKDNYEGGIEYKTDAWHPFGSTYNTDYLTFFVGGPEPINKYVLSKMGWKIPGQLNFFLSGNGTITDTDYNNHRTRDQISIFGLTFNERQNNTGNLNAKFDWFLSPQVKFALSYHGSWNSWSRFDWFWKDFPDHTVNYSRSNNHFSFKFNHTISKSTFYNLNFGYMDVSYKSSLSGNKPGDFWKFYADSLDTVGYDYSAWNSSFPDQKPYSVKSVSAPIANETTGFYNDGGFETYWRDDYTETVSFRGDITSQVTSDHLFKAGIELQIHDLQYIDIQDGGQVFSNYGKWKYEGGLEEDEPPGPFKEFGLNRWVFFTKPVIGGLFIQDKFEHKNLIINAGVRFDLLRHGDEIFQRSYKEQWEKRTGQKSNWKRYSIEASPRFGVSFPISERTVLFFSYGHFTQLPELQFMYRDPYSLNLIGNPHLESEQSVLYEFGFTNQFAQDWAIDIKSYAKDISRQVNTTLFGREGEQVVNVYDNTGYARSRGLELRLIKRPSGFYSGNATYTVQWADGYSSSAFDDYIRSTNDFPKPIRERRLSWDVRHQIVFQGNFIAAKNSNPMLFGLSIPDQWSTTLLASFSSGYPYTPGTDDEVERQVKENTYSGPITVSTDLKFQKWFNLGNSIKLTFYMDIFNLLNVNNVQIGYGFNNWTGKPFRYGNVQEPGKRLWDYYDSFRIMDPRQFSTDRYAKFGFRFDF
jgi:outer membrane receptor protein involved in Fe transport